MKKINKKKFAKLRIGQFYARHKSYRDMLENNKRESFVKEFLS